MMVASSRTRRRLAAALVLAVAGTLTARVVAQPPAAQAQIDVDARLKGFDDYMAQVMKDWNAPGIGVGIVVKDKLVFAKGYGFRDYGNKIPYTPTTTQPIASNSKLFTAVASGIARRRGKAALGRADQAVRSRHPLLQRRARPLGHDPRHVVASVRASPGTTASGTSPRSRDASSGIACATSNPPPRFARPSSTTT